MFWVGFEIGAGLFAFSLILALLAWIAGHVIDAADAWSSRISEAELKRRATLTSLGKWPEPPARPWSTRLEWAALTVGLLLMGLVTSLYRHWSRWP